MSLLCATTNTNTEFDNTFKSLQEEFGKANNEYSKLMEEATTDIHFDPRVADEAKEKLIEFAAEQERVSNYQSFGERFLRRVSSVPLLGGLAQSSADNIKASRLSDASVAELVSSMYDGLETQAATIVDTEKRLLQIYEHTKNNITANKELLDKVKSLQLEDIPNSHKSEIMKMEIQTSIRIEGGLDKLATLEVTLPATRSCLEAIYKNMPVSKAELLSNLTMSTGISQINTLAKDIKDMGELSDIVNNSIYESTQLALVNLLDLNTVSEADIKKLEDNSTKREALREKVAIASKEASKQLQLAHVRTQKLAEKSQQQRLALVNVTESPNANLLN